MANDIEVGIKVVTAEAKKQLTKFKKTAKDSLKGIDSESKKTSKGLSQLFNPSSMKASVAGLAGMATAVVGVGTAVIGAAVAVKKFTDVLAAMGDNVGKASQRMGVSIEFYQKMESAAKHAGTTIGTMETGMRRLLLSMTQVQQGNEKTTKAFEDLGVAVLDSNGNMRSQEDVFGDTLIALSKMENATARNAKAQEVLGRQASQLAPLFNEGEQAVRRYIDANDSAVMVSKEFAAASARYNDAMQTIGETFKKQINKSLEPFMKTMAEVVESIDPRDFEMFAESVGIAFTGILKAGALLGVGINAIFAGLNHTINQSVERTFLIVGGLSSFIAEQAESWSTVLGWLGTDTSGLDSMAQSVRRSEALMKGSAEASALLANEQLLRSNELQTSLMNYVLGIEAATTATNENTGSNDENDDSLNNRIKSVDRLTLSFKLQSSSLRTMQAITTSMIESIMPASVVLRETTDALGGFNIPWVKLSGLQVFGTSFQGFLRKANIEVTQAINNTKDEIESYQIEIEKLEKSITDKTSGGDKTAIAENIAIYKAGIVELESDILHMSTGIIRAGTSYADVMQKAWSDSLKMFGVEWLGATATALSAGKTMSSGLVTEITTTLNDQVQAIGVYLGLSAKQIEILKSSIPAVVTELENAIPDKGFFEALFGTTDQQLTQANATIDLVSMVGSTTLDMLQSFSDLRKQGDQQELNDFKKDQRDKLSGLVVTDRRRQQLEDKSAKEIEKREKELADKRKALQIANAWSGAFSAIPGIWGGVAQAYASIPFGGPGLVASIGGALTGMVLASAGAQTAAIQGLAEGGIVGGTQNASMGPDNTMVNMRQGEAVMTANMQVELLKIARGEKDANNGISVHVENFSGNDEDLSRLEDMLYELQSNGRPITIGA